MDGVGLRVRHMLQNVLLTRFEEALDCDVLEPLHATQKLLPELSLGEEQQREIFACQARLDKLREHKADLEALY